MRLTALWPIIGFAAIQFLAFANPAAATQKLPVAAVTIYPGDIIRDNMLTDHDFADTFLSDGYVNRHSDLVGKVAKRTLLPGQPILTIATGMPRLVTIGAMVKLVFEEGGLVISTYASALQAGSAGDIISVRNLESGLVLTGVIAPDGSIHVSNG